MAERLTDNQERLLAALRAEGEGEFLTTEQLGRVRDRYRQQITTDSARKVMGRLEDRGLVSGEGSGRERKWWLTDAGVELINLARPPRSESESGESGRPYTVLEETTLAALLTRALAPHVANDPDSRERLERVSLLLQIEEVDRQVYVVVGEVEARNTEHAFRQVAKDVYADRAAQSDEEVLTVQSVAVDGKRWKVVPVNVKADPRVTIG